MPFEDTTFSTNIDDVVAAADWLGERLTAPSLLIGHSLGGAAVLRTARRITGVRAVATVAAPYLPGRAASPLLDTFDDVGPEDPAEGPGPTDDDLRTVRLAGRNLLFRRRFLTDLAERSSEPEVISDIGEFGRRGVPLLVLHSPTDQTVPVTDAVSIFSAASWPKSLVSIPDADHLLTRRGSAQRVGDIVVAWARSVGIGGDTRVV